MLCHTIFKYVKVVVFGKFSLDVRRMRMRHGMIVKWAEDKGHTYIKMVKGRGKSLWDERKDFFGDE